MSETSRQAASGAGARVVSPGAEVSWKVAEVAQCDARGDHVRAVKLLAESGMRGASDIWMNPAAHASGAALANAHAKEP